MQTSICKIEVLIGYAYLTKLTYILDHARTSIFISMYIWRMDSKDFGSAIYKLNSAIVRAKKRGVRVYTVTNSGDVVHSLRGQKIESFKYAGANCFHNKIVVVDSFYSFVGSHNFSN